MRAIKEPNRYNENESGVSLYKCHPRTTFGVLRLDGAAGHLIMESELDYLREQFWEAGVYDFVRTRCDNMRKVYDLVKSVAPTHTTVLLTGETGTGKSLLAKRLAL